jgi:hypothetical protein
MSTVTVDSATAAALSGPKGKVEIRTVDGKLIGVFTPRREATAEDYDWARQEFTQEEIDAARKAGPGRPLADILADLRRKYGE